MLSYQTSTLVPIALGAVHWKPRELIAPRGGVRVQIVCSIDKSSLPVVLHMKHRRNAVVYPPYELLEKHPECLKLLL